MKTLILEVSDDVRVLLLTDAAVDVFKEWSVPIRLRLNRTSNESIVEIEFSAPEVADDITYCLN